tara:strand:+ start:90 stop:539 length:450 start_codon:yes stop_codon:yes gene_type:complete
MAGKGKIVRGALEGITNLADVRKEKELQSFFDDFREKISRRMEDQLLKIADHNWNFEVGDRVITGDEAARADNPMPWQIVGKTIRKKGLLPESNPREGKNIYGEDVPYYYVQRGVEGSDDFVQTSLPEWAITQKFGIDKKGALVDLVEE